ncbi:MAG: HEAT repeat domain-containing protein [Candidatus Omnitrophica bacterium]|nr:HEAT repeat domain-containing protein [Candidatus Omnitrophota bacterium]
MRHFSHPLLILILIVNLFGCSKTFWQDEPTHRIVDTEATSFDFNSKFGEDQIALLQQRADTLGKEPTESQTVIVLDTLNMELEREPIKNASLSQGLRSILVDLLKDPSEDVRFRSAEILGRIATEREEAALIRASSSDPSQSVREMASEAMELRGLGTEVWSE